MPHLATILELLRSYRQEEASAAAAHHTKPPPLSRLMKMEAEDDHGSSGSSEDVVIKIIRVVANMSISNEVGQQVAAIPEVYDNLTDILATRTISENEELILSTLATLNNLTYYPVESESKAEQDLAVYSRVEDFIACPNTEAQIEASRVLGNLTRSQTVRDQLAARPAWPAIVRQPSFNIIYSFFIITAP